MANHQWAIFEIVGECIILQEKLGDWEGLNTFLRAVVRWLNANSTCERNKKMRWISRVEGGIAEKEPAEIDVRQIRCHINLPFRPSHYQKKKRKIDGGVFEVRFKFRVLEHEGNVLWTREEKVDMIQAFGNVLHFLEPDASITAKLSFDYIDDDFVPVPLHMNDDFPDGVPHVLEVQRKIEGEGFLHVGYYDKIFLSEEEACHYYDAKMHVKRKGSMRLMNAHGDLCSDWDPVTKLRCIVRKYHGEIRTINLL